MWSSNKWHFLLYELHSSGWRWIHTQRNSSEPQPVARPGPLMFRCPFLPQGNPEKTTGLWRRLTSSSPLRHQSFEFWHILTHVVKKPRFKVQSTASRSWKQHDNDCGSNQVLKDNHPKCKCWKKRNKHQQMVKTAFGALKPMILHLQTLLQ